MYPRFAAAISSEVPSVDSPTVEAQLAIAGSDQFQSAETTPSSSAVLGAGGVPAHEHSVMASTPTMHRAIRGRLILWRSP
jgi:hypothetical protein